MNQPFSSYIGTVIMLVVFSLIWQFIMRKVMKKSVGVGNAIARTTAGASGAELANIINKGELRAVRMGL